MKAFNRHGAFTYVEVVVVLGMFAIAAYFMVPLSLSGLSSTRVSQPASDVTSLIFSTQQDSFTQKDGSAHGIRFNSSDYDVFIGASYATATYWDTFELKNTVTFTDIDLTDIATLTPTNELVFDRGSMKPNAYGTISLSDGSHTYTVVINQEGLVYYE
ncbi:type II secretion system protein [Candidatus Nomurabacteria bacterium]|uniref:Type II secretion system protein n=1 Tax=Candidatus Dojkabacteria bacterium TaxID=2099670 RepID=A0A955I0W1_9BACT|nr:type II secretion system protein [Candidatus Dojkabacteria bacterium]MCB9790372.1 type II secretion system protein [Candidatus Nomurabacteria bacterium]MCB9803649.1 type II secretion system protein [Candidatus Nomurabacteria bacterium]